MLASLAYQLSRYGFIQHTPTSNGASLYCAFFIRMRGLLALKITGLIKQNQILNV